MLSSPCTGKGMYLEFPGHWSIEPGAGGFPFEGGHQHLVLWTGDLGILAPEVQCM